MPGIRSRPSYTCARCLRVFQRQNVSPIHPPTTLRRFSQASPLGAEQSAEVERQPLQGPNISRGTSQSAGAASQDAKLEEGAMSRRLAQATEDAVLEGGRAGRRAVEDAGFSEELKRKLLEKVEAHKFRADNASAIAEAGLSSRVGRGSRDIATAREWTGIEMPDDTMLRMLDDARKPLKSGMRGPAKIPTPVVDLRLRRASTEGPGQRLANARDKSSIYAISKDSEMTEKEREDMRRELKERFGPTARAMPNSIRGLAALANERIEDAIARGQFKNIPRGKAIQRDARADNPFIDTTEYIMNKMIQRQDIVPPWIEKQQELVKAASVFRARLRMDWRRIAVRTIASRGGSLQEQMQLADRYAEAEKLYNPRKRSVEQISVPTNATEDPVMVKITQEVPTTAGNIPPVKVEVEKLHVIEPSAEQGIIQPIPEPENSLPSLFRIPAWEKAELSYLTLAVQNLNSITRSYNLMAPDLAKKPYFSLTRELNNCYADTAPLLAQTIKERASTPAKQIMEKPGSHSGGMLERLGGGTVAIYESKAPPYGFREFWKDLWDKKGN